MYLLTSIKKYLDLERIPYEHQVHRTAYTAQEVAAEEHIPGKFMAKTVVVKADNRLVLAVVPASLKVDFEALRRVLGAGEVRLATEFEFTGAFPDSEVGAMPPFGNLYGVPVCVDKSLAEDTEIVFNAGTHRDTIRMRYDDFARLVQPTVCSFGLASVA